MIIVVISLLSSVLSFYLIWDCWQKENQIRALEKAVDNEAHWRSAWKAEATRYEGLYLKTKTKKGKRK